MAQITQKEWLDFLHLLHNKLRNSEEIKLTGMTALNEINNFLMFRFLDDAESFGIKVDEKYKCKYLYEKYATDEKIKEDKDLMYVKKNTTSNAAELYFAIYSLNEENDSIISYYYDNFHLKKYIFSSTDKISIFCYKRETVETIQQIINIVYKKFVGMTFDSNFFDMFGSAYEEFKTNACGNGNKVTAQHFTNVFIKKIVINELKPLHNEIFYEPCAGSGGFIHTASHYVIENEGEEKSILFKKNIYANECNPEIFRPLIMNMLFHNIPIDNIQERDSLNKINLTSTKNKINVIATNYPFGMSNIIKENYKGYWDVLQNGKTFVKNSSAQFIIHIYHSLVNGGRTGFVSDRGILNNGTNKATSWESKLRKFMFENNNVYKIINLPQGSFAYTNFQTCIIFMVKGGNTQELKIYDAKFRDPKNKSSEIYVDDNPVSVFKIEDLRKNNYNINVVKEEEIKEGYIKLGEVIKFEKTPNRKASEGKEDGTYIFLCSSQKIKYSEHNDFNDYRIIIGSGGYGSIHYYKNFACSNDNFVLHIENYNTKYIYYYLKINMHLIKEGFKGNAIKHISKTYVEDIKIPQITLEHQQEIVTLLDDLFQNYNIELLQEYAKTIDIFKLLIHKKYDEFKNIIMLYYQLFGKIEQNQSYENNKMFIFNTFINHEITTTEKLNNIITLNGNGKFALSDLDDEGIYDYYSASKTNPTGKTNKYCFDDEGVYYLFVKSGGNKDNLLSDTGLGKIFKCEGKTSGNPAIVKLKLNDNINILSEYFELYMKYNVHNIRKYAIFNAGNGNIRMENLLNNFIIKIPTLNIQQNIINEINYINEEQKKYNLYIQKMYKYFNTYIDDIFKLLSAKNDTNNNDNSDHNDNNNDNNNVNNNDDSNNINNNDDTYNDVNNSNNINNNVNNKNNKQINKKSTNKKTTKKQTKINALLQEIANLEIPKSIRDIKTKKDKKYNIPYFTATNINYCQEATYSGHHILCTRVTQNQGTLSLVDGEFSASSDFIIIELKEEYTQYYEQVIEYIKNNFDYNRLIDEDPVFNTKNEQTSNIGLKHLKKFVINL